MLSRSSSKNSSTTRSSRNSSNSCSSRTSGPTKAAGTAATAATAGRSAIGCDGEAQGSKLAAFLAVLLQCLLNSPSLSSSTCPRLRDRSVSFVWRLRAASFTLKRCSSPGWGCMQIKQQQKRRQRMQRRHQQRRRQRQQRRQEAAPTLGSCTATRASGAARSHPASRDAARTPALLMPTMWRRRKKQRKAFQDLQSLFAVLTQLQQQQQLQQQPPQHRRRGSNSKRSGV